VAACFAVERDLSGGPGAPACNESHILRYDQRIPVEKRDQQVNAWV
jgi:hypothetical protein